MIDDIHEDQGHGHDSKYSLWRRSIFPNIVGRRDCYCTDIDWMEWRRGRPAAVIECRRAIGSLLTCEDVIKHFKQLNNSFQLEVYARMAHDLGIRAFIVAIKDESPENQDYGQAEFLVEEIIPPIEWPKGRIDMKLINMVRIGKFDQEGYSKFLAGL